MIKEISREIIGEIIEALPNAKFKVLLNNKSIMRAYISGRIRKNNIRILIGDKVIVRLTAYDPNKCIIISRKD